MQNNGKDCRYCEIRSESQENKLILEGMPVVFGAKTLIKNPTGDFFEQIEPSAFEACTLRNVHLFYNHDTSRVPLARTPNTMLLTVTPEGLRMRAELPNTESARSIYEAVKRGDLSGMSFAFEVRKDSYNPETNTRTIHEIARLLECSVVPYPAYPQASVEARSAIDGERKRFAEVRKAKILINQIRKVRL